MNPSTPEIVARLRKNAGWRDERYQCVTDPALLTAAAGAIEHLLAHIDVAEADSASLAREVGRLVAVYEADDQRIAELEARADVAESALREVQEGHPGFRCQEIARAYFDRTTPEGDENA